MYIKPPLVKVKSVKMGIINVDWIINNQEDWWNKYGDKKTLLLKLVKISLKHKFSIFSCLYQQHKIKKP